MFRYSDLLRYLQELNPEQLNQTVTVYISDLDETYAVSNTRIVQDIDSDPVSGVLDAGHVILVSKISGEI